MACTDVHAVTSKQLFKTTSLHSADSNAVYINDLPKSTTCPSSNYTHCSQLLLVHRMVAYSNHGPAENKMATRAMHIRDAFMLPTEPLTVRPYMEQGKEDSLHYHSNVLCSCHPTIHVSVYVKSMKKSDLPPHNYKYIMDPTSSTMHHTVQAACMQVMSLTSHILAHGIAVTDRPSGGATNIVVGKGSVNDCN